MDGLSFDIFYIIFVFKFHLDFNVQLSNHQICLYAVDVLDSNVLNVAELHIDNIDNIIDGCAVQEVECWCF